MATKLTPFRLPENTLDDLRSLAASNGDNLTTAVKEAAAQFRALVEEAGRQNGAELTRDEWVRLGHLDDPDPFSGLDVEVDSLSRHGIDWSRALAMELVGTWEGRDTTLPLHKAEAKACGRLAKRIAGWGRLRGYALMCALRRFWREPSAGIGSCAAPEVWMTPTAKE
jgi:hypothetical protein